MHATKSKTYCVNYTLIRDTFVHPDGFLQLYFYPDWTLVADKTMEQLSGGTIGSLSILLMGMMWKLLICFLKQHIYLDGVRTKRHIRLQNDWLIIRLSRAGTRELEDPQDYFALAKRMWEYMDTYLIDKEYGGWYNNGLDMTPDSKTAGIVILRFQEVTIR